MKLSSAGGLLCAQGWAPAGVGDLLLWYYQLCIVYPSLMLKASLGTKQCYKDRGVVSVKQVPSQLLRLLANLVTVFITRQCGPLVRAADW